MATSKKASKATTPAAAVFTLAMVIEATNGADGFLYTPASFHAPLVESGDVEVNSEIVNDKGEFATRATQKAMNQMTNTATQTATPAAAKPTFAIAANIPMPEKKRNSSGLRAGRAPVYPFDQLEIGHSFFVADGVDEKGEVKSAYKSLASTLNAANVRFSEEIAGQTRVNRKGATVPATKQLRKFVMFDTVEDTTVEGSPKGARIFRVAVDSQ
jgi:hypothetical protein